MVYGIRTNGPHVLNKGRGPKFYVGSRVCQPPKKGRMTSTET